MITDALLHFLPDGADPRCYYPVPTSWGHDFPAGLSSAEHGIEVVPEYDSCMKCGREVLGVLHNFPRECSGEGAET